MRSPLLVSVLLVLVTYLAYQPVTGNGFISFDDPIYVVENPAVQEGFHEGSLSWAFSTDLMGSWHPLTWLSHIADVQLFGLDASRHHLMSVLLHALSAVLLFLALHRMTDEFWPSAFVAAVFALHPLRVESVAWASERKDVLAGFFWMLTLLAYARYARRPRLGAYLLVLLAFVLGLASKPIVITLPFVLLLLDAWPLRRWKPGAVRGLLAEKLPMFLLAAAAAWLTYAMQAGTGAMQAGAELSLGTRLANVPLAYGAYLWKTVWPVALAIFYPHPGLVEGGLSFTDGRVLGATGLLVIVTLVVLRCRRSSPFLAVGWFWTLGVLVPVIGIVQVGTQGWADRYAYLSMIGVTIAATWGVRGAVTRTVRGSASGAIDGAAEGALGDVAHGVSRAGRPLAVLGCAVLLACLLTTRWQVGHWRDSGTLYSRALEISADNHLAHFNLGVTLEERGDLDGALQHYREVLRVLPDDIPARIELARVLDQRGELDEAIELSRAVLKLDPDQVRAHVRLASLSMQQGQTLDAIRHMEQAVRLEPGNVKNHRNLGRFRAASGDLEAAEAPLRQAVVLAPDDADPHWDLAVLLDQLGKRAEAETFVQDTLRLEPGHPDANFTQGTLHFERQEMALAEASFLRASAGRPDWYQPLQLLGLARVAVGDDKGAVEALRQSLSKPGAPAAVAHGLAELLATSPDDSVRNGAEAVLLATDLARASEQPDPGVLATLAAAYAETGNYPLAIQMVQQAILMSPATAGRYQLQLTEYEAGRAYRRSR